MPKYKIEQYSDPVNVAEGDVDSFLKKYPNAQLIQEGFQNGTVGTDAPVVPASPSRASIIGGFLGDMVSPSADTSLDSKKYKIEQYSDPVNVTEEGEKSFLETYPNAQLLQDTSKAIIELPEDRDYGDTFEIPNFKSQSTKNIANAYQRIYGGENGGFEFDSNVNNITITALNGNSITVNTKGVPDSMSRARQRQADPFNISGISAPSTQSQKDDPQKLINDFLKNNFNKELNSTYTKNVAGFENNISKNVNDLALQFAEEEDVAYDPTQIVSSLMKQDDFRNYMRKNLLEKYEQYLNPPVEGVEKETVTRLGTGDKFDMIYGIQQYTKDQAPFVGTGLNGRQIDQVVDRMLSDITSNEVRTSFDNVVKTLANPLKEAGNFLEYTGTLKKQHIQSIQDTDQKRFAQVNDRIMQITNILNQPTGGQQDTTQSDLMAELKKLKDDRELLTPLVYKEGQTFLFGDNGVRISKPLADSSDIQVVDLTKDYDIAKVALKKELDTKDYQTIQSNYRIHNIEYADFNESLNKKLDVVVDVGVFDLPASEMTLKNLINLDRDALKNVRFADPDSSPVDLRTYIGNARQTQYRLATEHEAWKDLYLLNIDPGSIKASDVVSQAGNFAAGLVDALPFQSKEFGVGTARKNVFTTDRDELTDAEALINKINTTREDDQQPFELSEEQKDSFEIGFGEQFFTGLGGFVPMIAELGVVSYATGGMGTAAGIGNYLSKLKNVTYLAKAGRNSVKPLSQAIVAARAKKAKMTIDAYAKSKGFVKASGTAFNKAQALFIQGLQEEGKMALLDPLFGVDMPLGAGAGFVIGGHAMRKVLPTNLFKGFSGAAALNTALEKGLYSGLGGAAGAQTAAPLEAMFKDLQKEKAFGTFVDEKYGDMEDWAKHALMEVLQFSIIGLTHANKADRAITRQGKRNLLVRTEKELQRLYEEEGGGKLSNIKSNKKLNEKFSNQLQLMNEIQRQLDIANNRERFLDKNVLAADTQGLLEKFNRQYMKENGRVAFTMNVSTNGKGMKLGEGEAASVTKRNGKLHVDVDVSKMNEGTIPHEIYHVILRDLFSKDVGVQKALQETLSKAVGKMGLETIDPRTGEVRKIDDLSEAIKEAYEKTQDPNTTFEEFNANLLDLLQRPENKQNVLENNLPGALKQNLTRFLEKSLTGTVLERFLPELNTPDRIIAFMQRLGQDFGKGQYSPKLIKRFEKIEITEDGKKLIDQKNGEVLNIDKLAQKELRQESLDLSNANKKAFEKFEETGNKTELIGKVYENNQGLIQEFINTKFKEGLGVTREQFESEVGLEIYDKILNTYLKRDKKFADVPFGAYARQALFGGGSFGGGRLGNILKRLGQKGDLFSADIEGKEAQAVISETTKDFDDVSTTVREQRLTDPKKLQLSIDIASELIPEIQKDLQGRDLTKETYKSLRLGENAAKALARTYDIRNKKGELLPEWFTVPARNLPQGSIEGFRKLRSELNKNAQMIVNILPEGYTLDKKSTGVPDSIQKIFYTKKKIGSRTVYELKKNISVKDIKELLKEPEGKLYRDKQVQEIKGLAELVFRGLINNVARGEAKTEGAVANDLKKLADGKNPKLAQLLLGELKEVPGVNDTTLPFLVGAYLNDKEALRKTNPTFVENFEALTIRDAKLLAEKGKADAPTFKTSDKADMKIAETSGAPKGVKAENIFDGETGKSMRSTQVFKRKEGKFKKGVFIEGTQGPEIKRSIFDTARLETFLDGVSELAKYFPKDLQKYFTKEVLLQSFGSTSRGTARNVGEDFRKITTEGGLVSESKISKGQYERIVDNLGEKYKQGVFDNIEPGDFMSDAQQKNALQKFFKTGDLESLKKYINASDNAYKSDVYYAMGVMKQNYLYDAKTAAEFEARARVIYQLAAENSGATSGYGRQFVPIMAVKKTGEPGKLKLEHLKSSLEQSMQEAKAIVEGRWAKDGRSIMNDYKGIISFKKYLDVIDKLGGTTNTSGLARMVLDLQNLKDYVTVESGFTETLYDKLMKENAVKVGAKLRELNVPWLKDQVAKQSLEPSKPNEVVLKASLENKADTKSSWQADIKLAKKAGTLDSKEASKAELLNQMNNRDKAIRLAQKQFKEVKKARVFDFDDTLARSKSNVLYTMPDGTKGKLNATEFAKRSETLEAAGAKFDFSEFSKVIDGKKGPLFDLAKFINESPGKRDMFVLTARPADAAPAIKKFLKGLGLDIPLENITGLANGAPSAKSNWILEKAANGYNDFYFADDAIKNVKAVKEVLDVIDVKGKVQLALAQKKLGKSFNEILQEKTGIAAEKTFSAVKAEVMGKGKGIFDVLISPGAEDFAGLLYKTLPKGKKGEEAFKFYKDNLFDPFARAEDNITRDQIALSNDVRALKKRLGVVPKDLRKKNETGFTNEQALRVRMWTKMGVEVPGLSKSDLAELNKVIKDNPKLEAFADQLLSTTKNDGWAEPKKNWLSGTLTSDARALLGTVKRAKYLEEWKQNKDEIFSEENLNKLEAAYGKNYRKALEGTLARMESGRNRTSKNNLENRVLDYVNNSVGAIMFLNSRSAILQTISSINFINWSDNNPLKASARLADVKQYSKDFLEIMNSDYLVARRDGLKLNISEAEIAADTGSRGIINTILKKGFVFTRYADSFAIASGGATFYRNRINTYKKQGMSEVEAKEKAFLDFKEISEESQQSSRTDKISQQQASNLGRVVLAFANTPMQYARLQKKAILDLANGRGDWRTNTSKIVYYGFVQNVIFNAIQSAIFGLAFSDDEDQQEKLLSKSGRIANGMADSLLRGTGFAGATVSAVKNAALKIASESEKSRPKYSKAVLDLISVSPTIGSKVKKLSSAAKSAEYGAFNDMEFSLDNQAYMALANVISATTNIPADRALKKMQNVEGSLDESYEYWERIAMAGGWSDWELGLESESDKKQPTRKLVKRKKTGKRKFKQRKFK